MASSGFRRRPALETPRGPILICFSFKNNRFENNSVASKGSLKPRVFKFFYLDTSPSTRSRRRVHRIMEKIIPLQRESKINTDDKTGTPLLDSSCIVASVVCISLWRGEDLVAKLHSASGCFSHRCKCSLHFSTPSRQESRRRHGDKTQDYNN